MQIQIVSDIHTEFWHKKEKFQFFKPSAPILALLGDIGCCGSEYEFNVFKRFIFEIEPLYEKILYVAGNHDYYSYTDKKKITINDTIQGIHKKIKEFFSHIPSGKVKFMNNSSLLMSVKNKTYLVVGTTLWTWIPENKRKTISENMSDYKHIYIRTNSNKIRNITPLDVCNMHLNNYKYIKSQIIRAKRLKCPIIILTHHKPYKGNIPQTNLSSAYENDLSSIIKSPIVLWGYGHTHISDATNINKVLVYSNPKGYPFEHTKFKSNVSVKI